MDDPDQVPLALKGEPFGGGAGLDLEAGTLAPVGKAPLQQGDPGVLLDEQLAELSQLDDLVDLVELVGRTAWSTAASIAVRESTRGWVVGWPINSTTGPSTAGATGGAALKARGGLPFRVGPCGRRPSDAGACA